MNDAMDFLNLDERRAICLEACKGVRGARPNHPQLLLDVRRAETLAILSPTFRAAVVALTARAEAPAATPRTKMPFQRPCGCRPYEICDKCAGEAPAGREATPECHNRHCTIIFAHDGPCVFGYECEDKRCPCHEGREPSEPAGAPTE